MLPLCSVDHPGVAALATLTICQTFFIDSDDPRVAPHQVERSQVDLELFRVERRRLAENRARVTLDSGHHSLQRRTEQSELCYDP